MAIVKYRNQSGTLYAYEQISEWDPVRRQSRSKRKLLGRVDEETGEIMTSDISLSLRNGKITMERKGDFSNTMVFAKGQRFEGVYHTPYGEMDMAVFTKEAACKFGKTEGNIHLKYQLNIQGNYTSTNELHLEYKAGKQHGETEKGQ